MITQRPINLEKDRQLLLEFHCDINYASDSPWARAIPFKKYRAAWLASARPQEYLDRLEKSLRDHRTIAEIWEEDGLLVGYLWVTFTDVPDYGFTMAEIQDIGVLAEQRQQGIATQMLERVEELAKNSGAAILRSGTGIENRVSQKLHADAGFQVYRVEFEKVLRNPLQEQTE